MPRSPAGSGCARPVWTECDGGPGLDGMAILFTADTHFGDPHILRHRGARFGSIEAHDEALVAGWNAVVGPEDAVWHLGDFAAHASRTHCAAIFARLNGTKRLVRGNHDSNRVLDLPWAEPPVESARLSVADAQGRPHRLFLSHYAHRAWPGLWRETRHLYGHSHGWLADTTRSCDVGVDAWSDRPVTLDAILLRQDAADGVPEELAAHGLR
ncbi:Calcineurin-like phosphoesterase superfamily protein [Methylobacterium sp. UNC378MF]|nr:Calcineurin-like phosphoesterase superfamily protein [Methylobacterium sp. UNC378MF]